MQIRAVSIENVTTVSSRYGFPQFCPTTDGLLVFQRFGTDPLTGPTYSIPAPGIYLAHRNPGISPRSSYSPFIYLHQLTFVSDTSTWQEQLLSSSGNTPTWSADGQRVFIQSGSYPNVLLNCLTISTLSPVTIIQTLVAQSKYATTITLSPDASYVAFIEFQELYLAPFQNPTSSYVTIIASLLIFIFIFILILILFYLLYLCTGA